MTNFLADILLSLSDQEHIVLSDAVNALLNYTHRYQAMFDKMIKIRAQAPVMPDEPKFRRTEQGSDEAYLGIANLLQKFEHYLQRFEQELPKLNEHPLLLQDLCNNLMSAINKLILAMQAVYQGKSTSFASVLNDLIALQNLFLQKLVQGEAAANLKRTAAAREKADNERQDNALKSNEKYVFVRIFHREMPTLITGKGNFLWVKPLLDSVKHAEKHGLAVYENEADVIKSLKDEQYGYITLKISDTQDITEQRPLKKCSIVGCRLLTIRDISLSNIIKLSHQEISYEIHEGVLHRIKAG